MLSRNMIQNIFYVYILAAGVLWGMIGLFFNHLTDLGLDRLQIMLLRVGIAAICAFILPLPTGICLKLSCATGGCFLAQGFAA